VTYHRNPFFHPILYQPSCSIQLMNFVVINKAAPPVIRDICGCFLVNRSRQFETTHIIRWHCLSICFNQNLSAYTTQHVSLQPVIKCLILPRIYSKTPSDTLPTNVGKPKYFSPSASVSISNLPFAASLSSSWQFSLKRL
jgi:hypothetical protein